MKMTQLSARVYKEFDFRRANSSIDSRTPSCLPTGKPIKRLTCSSWQVYPSYILYLLHVRAGVGEEGVSVCYGEGYSSLNCAGFLLKYAEIVV